MLVGGHEELRDPTAEAARAFHRPLPVGPRLGPPEELSVYLVADGQSEVPQLTTGRVQRDRGHGALVGIDPDGDHVCGLSLDLGWTAAGSLTSRTSSRLC